MSSPGPSSRRPSVEGVDDVCPICLCPMDDGFSRPENCQHRFDLDCLTEWSKLRLSCPSCRAEFGAIYTYEIVEARPKLVKVQKVEAPKEAEPFDETNPHDFTMCEICAGGQHEELLLICDQCDKGFHTYCLTPPLDGVPTTEQWFCPQCEQTRNSLPSTSRTTAPSARTIRLVQRTALAERVRRLLQRSRRLLDISEESSEEESEEGDDEGDEEADEDQEDGSDASSEEEEEEVHEFFDDDARVLAEIGDNVPDDGPALP
ncbi:PHD-finger, partial [Ancylostoma duodenale]